MSVPWYLEITHSSYNHVILENEWVISVKYDTLSYKGNIFLGSCAGHYISVPLNNYFYDASNCEMQTKLSPVLIVCYFYPS